MTHISMLHAEGTLHPVVQNSGRAASLGVWRGLVWPINEVLLTSLLRTGKSREEIARLYAVAPERVDRLRDAYGV
jgi:hypothetical protein